MDRPPVWKKPTTESAIEDLSRRLVSKKKGPYQVIKVHGHAVTIAVKGLYNTVPIDRVTLTLEEQRTSEATTQVGSPTELDDQPSIDDEGNSRE